MLENGIESWDLSESSAAKESGIREKEDEVTGQSFSRYCGVSRSQP